MLFLSRIGIVLPPIVGRLVVLWLGILVWVGSTRDGFGQADAPATQATAVAIRPCQYKGVTPGETSGSEAVQRLGTPDAEEETDGLLTLRYSEEPFRLVEVHVMDEVVTSIVLHFETPASPTQIEYELQLQDLEPAPVHDENDKLLGRVYPERGVLMSFDPDLTAHRAMQLLLEPITSEPFRLRVQNDREHRYQKNLADLEVARQLDPDDAETLRLLARVSARSGEVRQARKYLDEASALLPGNSHLALDRIELLIRLDQLDDALVKAKGVVADRHEDPQVQARAEKLLGDALALGAKRRLDQAIEHHMAAVKLMAPLANDELAAKRRAAKEFLTEVFLAIAFDIAAGEWQNQEPTTEKWLTSARELAESLISRDQGDEWWRLRVALASLSVRAELPASQPVDDQVAAVTRMTQQLGDASADPLYRRELEFLRIQALFDAATIAHRRGQSAQAREFADQGVRLIDPLVDARHLLPMERYLFGRLHFFVGSAIAVTEKKHELAVQSYAKAREFFSATPPTVAGYDLGRQGERWVSMGASYFESGNREMGVRLTREGIDNLKQAAGSGLAAESALTLPYSNLAAMYQVLGNSEESREFSEMAARTSPTPAATKRR